MEDDEDDLYDAEPNGTTSTQAVKTDIKAEDAEQEEGEEFEEDDSDSVCLKACTGLHIQLIRSSGHRHNYRTKTRHENRTPDVRQSYSIFKHSKLTSIQPRFHSCRDSQDRDITTIHRRPRAELSQPSRSDKT
jgi:hypothetical protein